MKRCININTQIVVSMQLSTDHLPKEFNYTCFFWLPNCGIFNEYTKLVACGTQEGAIVIIGKKENITNSDVTNASSTEYNFVSLLAGHETAITDICFLSKTDTFLSVSKDAKICGWSCKDCTCEFEFDFNLNYGDYFFTTYANKFKYIWLTRYGDCIFLIDLTKRSIIRQYPYPGIKSFEIIISQPNLKNSYIFAVCIGAIQTTLFLIENKFDLKEKKTFLNDEKFEKNEIIKVCQSGVIKIVKNSFEIINPISDFEILYHGTFPELSTNDFIKLVSFNKSHTLFAACSYFGRFYIVDLKNNFNSKSVQYFYPFANINPQSLFSLSNFAINDQQDIVFASDSNTIFFVNDQKQIEKVECKESGDDYESDVIFMNDSQTPYFIKSHGSLLSFYSIQSQKPFRTIQFHRKITAIFERKIDNDTKKTKLFVGFDNGAVCLYSNHYCRIITVLTAEIQSFIFNEYTNDLIAIGVDGSACLFFKHISFISIETRLIPIQKVHYIPYIDLYSFGYDDGSYLIYSAKSPLPIEMTQKLPKKAKLIWPFLLETGYRSEIVTTSCVKLGRKSVVYNVIDVPKLCDTVRENFFPYHRNTMNDMKLRAKVKYLIGLCNEMFDLMENEVNDLKGSNFSLIGANHKPTFFYNSFHFNGEMICDLSPFNSSSQYISYYLLSEASNREGKLLTDKNFFGKVHFLPSLLQFMYFNDDTVKRTVCRLCILLSGYVSFQTCQEYLIKFTTLDNLDNVEEYDKFLMCILIVRYPNTLPSFFISELYEFLDELTVNNSEQAVLAISILIDGISLWQSKTEKKEQIYITIIESMLRQTRSIFLCNKFYNVACSDMESLIKSFPVLIQLSICKEEMTEKVFNLYTNIAFENQKVCGGIISDLFASTCQKFPQLIDIVAHEIESHSKIFQFVKNVDNLFLIGLQDGVVKAYQNGKLLFSEQLFDDIGDLSFVDIGPQKKFGVAVSEKVKKGKIFYLCKSIKRFFKSDKSRVVMEFDVTDLTNKNYFHANWIDIQNCEITVTH